MESDCIYLSYSSATERVLLGPNNTRYKKEFPPPCGKTLVIRMSTHDRIRNKHRGYSSAADAAQVGLPKWLWLPLGLFLGPYWACYIIRFGHASIINSVTDVKWWAAVICGCFDKVSSMNCLVVRVETQLFLLANLRIRSNTLYIVRIWDVYIVRMLLINAFYVSCKNKKTKAMIVNAGCAWMFVLITFLIRDSEWISVILHMPLLITFWSFDKHLIIMV